MKIAVIDDNLTVLAALVAIIRSENHETDGFESAETFSANSQGNYDCIVVDFMLAGANGCELIQALRDNNDDVPAILISGNLSFELTHQSSQLTNVTVLRKPCLAQTLIDTIQDMVPE